MSLRIPPNLTPIAGEGNEPEAMPINSIWYRYLQALQASIPTGTGIPEAPQNGITYGRNNATWVQVISGIPEAPLDGQQYGRQSAQWTVISPGGGGGTPGAPRYSIQYNDPLGTFAGSAEVLMNPAASLITVGATTEWTIKPSQQQTEGLKGLNLTIKAGQSRAATGISITGGDLLLESGAADGTKNESITGTVVVQSADGNAILNGYTGSVTIQSGIATGAGSSGEVLIAGGDSNSNSAGSVSLRGGGSLSSACGPVNITGGTGSIPGNINITGGSASGASTGGLIRLIPGGSASGSDGYIDLVLANDAHLRINGAAGTSGQVLTTQGTGTAPIWASLAGTGTVTSVALSLPSFITVTGSPVTTSGTLTGTLASQTANTIFAGPTTGAPNPPTFRAMVTADIPDAAVTFAKIQDVTANSVPARAANTNGVLSAVTLAASQLLGRGSTGDVAAITLGTGLAMTGATLSASGASIPGFTASLETAAPNNTDNASRFLASGGTSNQDTVLQPKAAGAFLAQLPDSTATGGNKRGQYAVDLSLARLSANQVAEGLYSFNAGQASRADGANSIAISTSGRASGSTSAVIGGNSCAASGTRSFAAGGSGGTASGTNSSCIGGNNSIASGANATAFGEYSTANADYSFIIGVRGDAKSVTRCFVHGGGLVGSSGDTQVRRYVLWRDTTNATPVSLSTESTAPTATTAPTVQLGGAAAFVGTVLAKASGGDTKMWTFSALLKNVGGTTSLVGAATVTTIANDAGAAAWALAITANNTLDTLSVDVTGALATNIRWIAEVTQTEVV
jgi:hypothetical protein